MIFFQSIGPEVIAHFGACFLNVRGQPRQHRLECGGFIEVFVSLSLRLTECLVQRLRHPAVLFIDIAPDHHGVHDWKDFCFAVIGLFDTDIAFKKPLYLTATAQIGRRHAGRVQRINFATGKHRRQCLVGTDALDLDVGR